jgi:hypothetical protein
MKIRISPTIQNEYLTRCVWENEGWERFPETIGLHEVDEVTAKAMLDDAEFQEDWEHGPDQMPPGIRRAYAALATQLRHGLYDPKPGGFLDLYLRNDTSFVGSKQ